MKIKVLQKDINLGEKGNGCNCPIARALNRKFKKHFRVTPTSISNIHSRYLCSLPTAAQKFIHKFDNGRKVKPFQFEIPKLLPVSLHFKE